MLCYAMLCYAMLCYAMAMLRYAMLRFHGTAQRLRVNAVHRTARAVFSNAQEHTCAFAYMHDDDTESETSRVSAYGTLA